MTEKNRTYDHGGNIYGFLRDNGSRLEEILDFSANINPLGPPEWLRPCISASLDAISHYPDPYCNDLRAVLAAVYGVREEMVVAANGSTELLYQLPRVLDCKRAVVPVPCYIDYLKVMELANIPVLEVELDADQDFIPDLSDIESRLLPGDLLVIGSPNNPTGALIDTAALKKLIDRNPEVIILLDEAFLEFVQNRESLGGYGENVITLHSLTKFYGIPGLRLGFGIFPEKISRELQRLLPPWSVNSLAQEIGKKAVIDVKYQEESRAYLQTCRKMLVDRLGSFQDLHVYPSAANYLLVRLTGRISVQELSARMLVQKIIIRDCANYRNLSGGYFRIAVRSVDENHRFLESLEEILLVGKKNRGRQKTPAVMFQGTSSNAGKSILTAALCRILLQDGVRVAPFKAQNMSLNSFVTRDGLEMGRAQVVQAQAARLDPDVRMNPILLKPNSDTGSQIIVKGRPVGNMAVMEYVRYKKKAVAEAHKCYSELAAEYDAMVIEGAGSPGEVNLKHHDIVNMSMARYAESPVILVGDIDRGGVYASFVGTMEVLNQWERSLVAGFLVNRFRGDERLLSDAHAYVKMHTGRDVLGVVPYIHHHGIPEEDSVSFKEGFFEGVRPAHDHVEIVVIALPHISNFTDIEPFVSEPDVFLRTVDRVEDIGNPDVIILPGSKNVIGDVAYLFNSGLAGSIREMADKGCEIVGICGGYQMLGKTIGDPEGIESHGCEVKGMALIEMGTELAREKTLLLRTGTDIRSGQPVSGYEIHHGKTRSDAGPLFVYSDGSTCGTAGTAGHIWGCYLHGIFDSDLFRRHFINIIRKRKGLSDFSGPLFHYDLEPSFDRLADTVRQGLDMERIYQLLRL